MQIVPFKVSDAQYSLYVILEPENIDRIWQHDPAEVTLNKLPAPWSEMKLKDVVISFATPSDMEEVHRLLAANKPQDALRFLSRGFRYRPDASDSDEQYKPEPKPKTSETEIEVHVRKKSDDPEGITRVSLGGGEKMGGFYCVYRGSKEDAYRCLQECFISMGGMIRHLGPDKEPDVSPDDGKWYA